MIPCLSTDTFLGAKDLERQAQGSDKLDTTDSEGVQPLKRKRGISKHPLKKRLVPDNHSSSPKGDDTSDDDSAGFVSPTIGNLFTQQGRSCT